MYDATLRRVRVAIVGVEKQYYILYVFSFCVCVCVCVCVRAVLVMQHAQQMCLILLLHVALPAVFFSII